MRETLPHSAEAKGLASPTNGAVRPAERENGAFAMLPQSPHDRMTSPPKGASPFPIPSTLTAPDVLQNEVWRLKNVRALGILDTPAEERFDELTRLASAVFNAPISLLTFVDGDREWFKSAYGVSVREIPREHSFCPPVTLHDGIIEVRDTTQDPQLQNHPWVLGELNVRFYAGVPLKAPNGAWLGTLSVLDRAPRSLTPQEAAWLQSLAKIAQLRLEAWVLQREPHVLALWSPQDHDPSRPVERPVLGAPTTVLGPLPSLPPAPAANPPVASRQAPSEFVEQLLGEPLASLEVRLQRLRHELGTGLTVPQTEALEALAQGLASVTQNVHQSVDLRRLQAGQLRLQTAVLDLSRLAQESVTSWKTLHPKDPRPTEARSRGEVWVRADPHRLFQVLQRLLEETRASSLETDHIVVSTAIEGRSGFLRIRWGGTGTTDASSEHAPIESLSRSKNGDGGSSHSFGLDLARVVVELHGGHFTCYRAGALLGSIVVIELPLAESTPVGG